MLPSDKLWGGVMLPVAFLELPHAPWSLVVQAMETLGEVSRLTQLGVGHGDEPVSPPTLFSP